MEISIPVGYYVESNTGLLSSLDLTSDDTEKQRISDGRLAGLYKNVPSTSATSGTSATFDINIIYDSSSLGKTTTYISDVEISNPGKNYTEESIININGSTIGGISGASDFSFSPSKSGGLNTQVFIFKSPYYDINGNKYFPEEIEELNDGNLTAVKGGFSLLGEIIQGVSGSPAYLKIMNPPFLSQGFGWSLGDFVPLVQYTLDGKRVSTQGNSLLNSQNISDYFAGVNVAKVATYPGMVAPYLLLMVFLIQVQLKKLIITLWTTQIILLVHHLNR